MTKRNVIIGLIVACLLLTNPPLMFIYNKPLMVLGIPMYIFFMELFSITMVVLLFVLYRIEFGPNSEYHKRTGR